MRTVEDLRKLLKRTDEACWLLIHTCQWLEGTETDEEFIEAVRNNIIGLKAIGADELREKLIKNFSEPSG